MGIDANSPVFETALEYPRRGLPFEARNDDAGYADASSRELVDQSEDLGIVGRAEIGAYLFTLHVAGIEADNDLSLVSEVFQKAHLDIGIKAGKASCRMIVENQLAAKFEIKFIVVPFYTFSDRGGLFAQISFVIEAYPEIHNTAY